MRQQHYKKNFKACGIDAVPTVL